MQSLEQVAACRAQLWDAGFRPVPVLTNDKAPMGKAWPEAARKDPPECITLGAVSHALNTGILCDGLRAIDYDIDNQDIAARCYDEAVRLLGAAPRRYRANSPRSLSLYRAAEGMPRKLVLAGKLGKIEVLGVGQQFVAFGLHPSGADLLWEPCPPGLVQLSDLPAVTEAALHTYLVACAPFIEAEPPVRRNGQDPHFSGEPQADPLRVVAALNAIPQDKPKDWEAWNRIGMAVWAATGGGQIGFLAFDAWSSRHPSYDPRETRARWEHYPKSPPTQIGAGTLFHIARGTTMPPGLVHPDDGPEPPLQPLPRNPGRIITGDAHIGASAPPDWLVDGIVQRGRLYACTSLTAHGKTAVWLYVSCMIHAGRMVGNLDAVQGNVLYLAGENPSDLAARMLGMCRHYKIPALDMPWVLPATFPLTEEEADALKREIEALGIPFALIVGDTAASYFPGEDENDNITAGHYARTFRSLCEVAGNPAVVPLCHPVKHAARDNLLPRGGGGFLNELDANLTLWSPSLGEFTSLHWQGKIRGPDFSPLGFRLVPVPTGRTDSKNRQEMTIVAQPMDEEETANEVKQAMHNQNVVLKALRDLPGVSLLQIARDAGWVDADDKVERWKVQRAIDALEKDRLVKQDRARGPWSLTPKGEKELDKP